MAGPSKKEDHLTNERKILVHSFRRTISIVKSSTSEQVKFQDKFDEWLRTVSEDSGFLHFARKVMVMSMEPSSFMDILSSAIISLCLLFSFKEQDTTYLSLGLGFYFVLKVMDLVTFAIIFIYSNLDKGVRPILMYHEVISSMFGLVYERLCFIEDELDLDIDHSFYQKFSLPSWRLDTGNLMFINTLSRRLAFHPSLCNVYGIFISLLLFVYVYWHPVEVSLYLESVILCVVFVASFEKDYKLTVFVKHMLLKQSEIGRVSEDFVRWFDCEYQCRGFFMRSESKDYILDYVCARSMTLYTKDNSLNYAILVNFIINALQHCRSMSHLDELIYFVLYGRQYMSECDDTYLAPEDSFRSITSSNSSPFIGDPSLKIAHQQVSEAGSIQNEEFEASEHEDSKNEEVAVKVTSIHKESNSTCYSSDSISTETSAERKDLSFDQCLPVRKELRNALLKTEDFSEGPLELRELDGKEMNLIGNVWQEAFDPIMDDEDRYSNEGKQPGEENLNQTLQFSFSQAGSKSDQESSASNRIDYDDKVVSGQAGANLEQPCEISNMKIVGALQRCSSVGDGSMDEKSGCQIGETRAELENSSVIGGDDDKKVEYRMLEMHQKSCEADENERRTHSTQDENFSGGFSNNDAMNNSKSGSSTPDADINILLADFLSKMDINSKSCENCDEMKETPLQGEPVDPTLEFLENSALEGETEQNPKSLEKGQEQKLSFGLASLIDLKSVESRIILKGRRKLAKEQQQKVRDAITSEKSNIEGDVNGKENTLVKDQSFFSGKFSDFQKLLGKPLCNDKSSRTGVSGFNISDLNSVQCKDKTALCEEQNCFSPASSPKMNVLYNKFGFLAGGPEISISPSVEKLDIINPEKGNREKQSSVRETEAVNLEDLSSIRIHDPSDLVDSGSHDANPVCSPLGQLANFRGLAACNSNEVGNSNQAVFHFGRSEPANSKEFLNPRICSPLNFNEATESNSEISIPKLPEDESGDISRGSGRNETKALTSFHGIENRKKNSGSSERVQAILPNSTYCSLQPVTINFTSCTLDARFTRIAEPTALSSTNLDTRPVFRFGLTNPPTFGRSAESSCNSESPAVNLPTSGSADLLQPEPDDLSATNQNYFESNRDYINYSKGDLSRFEKYRATKALFNVGYCGNVVNAHRKTSPKKRVAIELDESEPEGVQKVGIVKNSEVSSLHWLSINTKSKSYKIFEQIKRIRNVQFPRRKDLFHQKIIYEYSETEYISDLRTSSEMSHFTGSAMRKEGHNPSSIEVLNEDKGESKESSAAIVWNERLGNKKPSIENDQMSIISADTSEDEAFRFHDSTSASDEECWDMTFGNSKSDHEASCEGLGEACADSSTQAINQLYQSQSSNQGASMWNSQLFLTSSEPNIVQTSSFSEHLPSQDCSKPVKYCLKYENLSLDLLDPSACLTLRLVSDKEHENYDTSPAFSQTIHSSLSGSVESILHVPSVSTVSGQSDDPIVRIEENFLSLSATVVDPEMSSAGCIPCDGLEEHASRVTPAPLRDVVACRDQECSVVSNPENKDFNFEAENLVLNYKPLPGSDPVEISFRKRRSVTKLIFKSKDKKLILKTTPPR